MKILVTGASGFVGKAFVNSVDLVKHTLVVTSRNKKNPTPNTQSTTHFHAELNVAQDWQAILAGCDVVVHLAAKAHDVSQQTTEATYFETNFLATAHLARQAQEAGIKRFIYLSTLKVMGEESYKPYIEEDACKPQDAYALSKYQAENILLDIAKQGQMEVVIIRPPLVYGRGVKANFASLLKWVRAGVPLPLLGIRNQRSLVYLGNLVDFIHCCLTHPSAKNMIFFVSDDADVSTATLVNTCANALCVKPQLFYLPEKWLYFAAKLMGKSAQFNRLCGNLQVDIYRAKNLLGWKPPYTMAQGLAETVALIQ